MKFRTKPVEKEAIQYTGADSYYKQMGIQWPEFIGKSSYFEDNKEFLIFTLEGDHKVNEGDWVIKGLNGEFYPCKPDIFEKTYEKIE